jgi:tetratricopeptide (TPR) repeat protein
MCGGNLEVAQGSNVGTCPYCGSTMTLPKLDDERRVELFNRGNHFRRNGDYDKAAGVFDTVLSEDPTDAEAYWSLVLCRYGIAYVEDPKTGQRLPTTNRLQTTSILADADYQQALKHAEGAAQDLYQQEAEAINQIQKAALAVVQNEEAFDVFICYKETDSANQRTKDSAIAQELYQELTRNGIRPFFARVTLESKAGTEYEPYIFAALQSSKAMVVVGTTKDNFEAPWVKNEWNRYLALAKEHPEKKLIPVYRDMDPYDLPDELSALQALDASRLGFMQDLVHGLEKILAEKNDVASNQQISQSAQAQTNTNTPGVDSLYQRMLLFLEDGEFEQAAEYADRILDLNPQYAPAYMGKFMAEVEIKNETVLLKCYLNEDEFSNKNWDKALRFADGEQKQIYEGYRQAMADNWAEKLANAYEWEGSGTFGKANDEPIRWLSLAVQDRKVLIITEEIFMEKRFDPSSNAWQTSEIRQWLNDDFLNSYFTLEECLGVLEVTEDKVFLLSTDEAKLYFPSDQSRIAKYQGKSDTWWLRSPAGPYSRPALITNDGSINSNNSWGVNVDFYGVRPALWLNLKSGISESQVLKNCPVVIEQERRQAEQQREQQIAEANQQREAQRRQAWESQGLCRYCGGKLSIFGDKCKNCGKQN